MGTKADKGPNRAALDRTLVALRDAGRLEVCDSALVALCESAADAMDAQPYRASFVKEYRECLVLLSGLGSGDGDDLEDLIARISGTPMGDSPKV